MRTSSWTVYVDDDMLPVGGVPELLQRALGEALIEAEFLDYQEA
jgi:hypothetical protein